MDHSNEAFLLECMKENLAHARHVEDERMMFNSLFAALVGGTLAVISQLNNTAVIGIMIGLLMLLNILCFFLTKRWNIVFKSHYALAKSIYMQFFTQGAEDASNSSTQQINRYYLFNNRPEQKSGGFYIGTGKYFLLYNAVIFILLICALVYFLSSFAI